MLTDLQTRKLTRMFNAYDADHSGYLEFADLEAHCNNLAHLSELAAGSQAYNELQSGYRAVWDEISRFGDADHDGRVTTDEWLAYCADVIQSPDTFTQGIGSISRLSAKLLDRDGDGLVSREEFAALRTTLDTDSTTVFQRFDLDGDGYVSGDEFVTLFRQFFLSDDPDAPGNTWYGPI